MRHIRKPFQPDFKIEKEQCRNHEQDAVKECPPRGEYDRVAKAADFPCQYGIARPHKCRKDCQQIPHRVQFQFRAVKADQRNTRHRHHKAYKKICPQLPFRFQEQARQDCREKRRN